jgi:hypothetical protein
VGNSLKVVSDENSCAEMDDSSTTLDVPINNGHITKITTERVRQVPEQ